MLLGPLSALLPVRPSASPPPPPGGGVQIEIPLPGLTYRFAPYVCHMTPEDHAAALRAFNLVDVFKALRKGRSKEARAYLDHCIAELGGKPQLIGQLDGKDEAEEDGSTKSA